MSCKQCSTMTSLRNPTEMCDFLSATDAKTRSMIADPPTQPSHTAGDLRTRLRLRTVPNFASS